MKSVLANIDDFADDFAEIRVTQIPEYGYPAIFVTIDKQNLLCYPLCMRAG